MAEVPMELIKKALTGSLGRDVLRMDVRVLPYPAYLDKVFIALRQTKTERSSVARTRIHYNAGIHTRHMGFERKAHACAITHEQREIVTQWLWLRWSLAAQRL